MTVEPWSFLIGCSRTSSLLREASLEAHEAKLKTKVLQGVILQLSRKLKRTAGELYNTDEELMHKKVRLEDSEQYVHALSNLLNNALEHY